MTIDIKCGCGAAYRLAEERAGETFTCKVCQARMQIPGGVPRAIFNPEPASVPAAAAVAPASIAGNPDTQWSSSETFPPRPAEQPTSSEPAAPGFLGGAPVVRLKGFQAGALDTSIRPPIDPAAPGVESRVCPSKGSPEAAPRQADGQVVAPAFTPRQIPAGWWLVRGGLVAVCVGMFFAPWFTMAFPASSTQRVQEQSISGWGLACRAVKGVLGGQSSSPREQRAISGTDVPEGAAKAAAGAIMMACGPVVYVLGALLVAVFSYVANRREGRGAVWPFVIFHAGLTLFIVGWWLLSSCGPMQAMLGNMRKFGLVIGPSVWPYVLWFILGAFIVIARGRPDLAATAASRAVSPEPEML